MAGRNSVLDKAPAACIENESVNCDAVLLISTEMLWSRFLWWLRHYINIRITWVVLALL